MKVILLIVMWALCDGTNSPLLETNPPAKAENFNLPSNRRISITFTGTVKSIELLGKRALKFIPVDIDPKFAVTVGIEALTPRETPLRESGEEVFAIHSPARLFLTETEEVIGNKFRFDLTWERVSGRFSQLRASPID